MEETGIRQTPSPVVLQVMICSYGADGLKRIAKSARPKAEGVEYLVSHQPAPGEKDPDIPKELERDDFRILAHRTKGLSVNRNFALSQATAPLLLISDDDADYTEVALLGIIDAFHSHEDMDILTFRYESATHPKQYPASSRSLSKPEKGYFVSSLEIAFRRDAVQGKVWFNENFGIGATFPSGEEDIFIRDCLDAGLKGMFVPLTICRHDCLTTSGRNLKLPSRPQTKGAVFLHLHPHDWPLRMIAHAIREIPLWRKCLAPSPLSYCREWLKGVRMARRHKVFPTPDYSHKYPSHE